MAPPKLERPTRQVRAYDDTAEKLVWLGRLGDLSVADLIDKYAGREIDRDYERIASRVEIIKAAEAGDPADHLAPDLGENGGA